MYYTLKRKEVDSKMNTLLYIIASIGLLWLQKYFLEKRFPHEIFIFVIGGLVCGEHLGVADGLEYVAWMDLSDHVFVKLFAFIVILLHIYFAMVIMPNSDKEPK